LVEVEAGSSATVVTLPLLLGGDLDHLVNGVRGQARTASCRVR
jgi:hypothetical protein